MALAARRRWSNVPKNSLGPCSQRRRKVGTSLLALETLEDRTLLSTSVPLVSGSWTTLGPAPLNDGMAESGRITAIAADPIDANTYYVATASGGVWKTTDAGNDWTPLTDAQATLNMGAIAVAKQNPRIIYAGTGEPTLGPSKLAIARDNIYYGLGVLKSIDGGATWTLEGQTPFNRRSIAQVVIDPTDLKANIVYVAVGNVSTGGLPGNTGIWKSTDGGLTWTDTTATISTTAAFTDLAMDPVNSQILYAAVGADGGSTANGLYVTMNGGASWAPAGNFPSGSTDANLGRILVAIAPSSPTTIYASIAHSGANANLYKMMKSTNGGVTWSQLTNTPEYMFGFGDYADALAVDPSNPNTIYAGGPAGTGTIIRSLDGGSDWTDISLDVNGNGPHVDQHAFAFDASGRLLDGTDGGIWRLDNATPGTLQWTDINGNLDTLQFTSVALDPTTLNIAYGGAQDNGEQVFNNNLQWGTFGLGGDGGYVLVNPTNTQNIVFDAPVASFGADFFVQRTTDGGAHWTTITLGLNAANETSVFYPPFVMDPGNPSHLLLGTSRVYETLNQGDNWRPISTPGVNGWTDDSAITALAISPSDRSVVYAATANGHLFVTLDDGSDWQQIDIPGFSDHFQGIVVDPANSLKAFVVRDRFTGAPGGHVFETTNGGQSWTDISSNLPDVPATAIIQDPRDGALYLGTDAGVYASDNGGGTWARFGNNMPNVRIDSLVLSPSEQILGAGTNGRGMWEIPLTDLAVTSSLAVVNPGQSFSVTVRAQDPFGNLLSSYSGTVHFSSSDGLAGLPADYTFVSADQGAHTFSVTLRTTGNQAVIATDTSNNGVTGTAGVNVQTPVKVASFMVTSTVSTVTAGTSFSITVTALDSSNQVVTNYNGTVHFTSSDPSLAAVLPADYTFTAGDAGVHTFTGVTLVTAGTQQINATDTFTGSTGPTTVSVTAAALSQLVLSLFPTSSQAGQSSSLIVTAEDDFGNAILDYSGTVNFTSSDPQAQLPSAFTFSPGDNGAASFQVTFLTAGTQSITATDSVASLTGTVTGITVVPAPTSQFVFANLPTSVLVERPFTITVNAEDPFGNITPNYFGTVSFSSSDSFASLPPDYTFVTADHGSHTFTVTMRTSGSQALIATDAVNSFTGSVTLGVSDVAASFLVLGPSQSTAGTPFDVNVEALDPFGILLIHYLGTIHFATTDPASGVVLPADYTFMPSDLGHHLFTMLTLDTAGPQVVSVNDTTVVSAVGSAAITVTPGSASQLTVTGLPPSVTAGTTQEIKVTALDSFGNVATSYAGTVAFTSSDPQALLPGTYTFGTTDAGVHTFPVSLRTVGSNQSITVTDTVTASFTAALQGILVTPGLTSQFLLTGFPAPPAIVQAGTPISITVEAVDAFGNPVPSYAGTIQFSSSDPGAGLPANSTLTNGVGTFLIDFRHGGTPSLTVSDTQFPSLTGTQGDISVLPAPAIRYTISNLSIFAPAGRAETFTVSAADLFGDVVGNYDGVVHFSSTDSTALLPADYQFVPADQGSHTFTVTFMTTGPQTLTAHELLPNHISEDGQAGITILLITAPTQLYVAQLYRDLLHREVDPNGLQFFTSQLNAAVELPMQIVQEIQGSLESHTDEVESLYQQLLAAPPDATQLQTGVAFLGQAGSFAQLEANILGSDAYFSGPGFGTNDGFLAALYQTVLGRPLDATGEKIFSQLLANGASRITVAMDVLNSAEAQTFEIKNLYLQLLNRPVDPTGLSFFQNLLQRGTRVEQAIALIASSEEYITDVGGDGNQLLVMHVYQDLLGRPADAATVASLSQQLDAGTLTRRGLVTVVENSTEYRTDVIDQIYGQFLGRKPDKASLQNWINFLATGGTMQQIEELILASNEYFAGHGGGTNGGFLNALYEDVLGRKIDPIGLKIFSTDLANGVSREKIAAAILTSKEADTLVINTFYTRFLRRPADPTGATANVGLLQHGATLENMIILFLTSPEYFALQ